MSSDVQGLGSGMSFCNVCSGVSYFNVSSFHVEFWVQAQHPSQDPGPSSRQFQVGGFAPGGFNSDVVGQWNSYVDIRGDSVHWDDIEHVGPGMPTT